MFAHLTKPRFLLVAVLALSVLLIGATACSDDDDDDADAADGVTLEAFQKNSVLTMAMMFRVEGLHDIDDTAQTADEIEAGWSGSLERLHAGMLGTSWPEELQEGADATIAALEASMADLEAEDLAGFKGHITEAHAAWHELEHPAYAFVGGEEHNEDDGHGEEATGEAEGHDDATEEASH
jgi:hypothetical protein